MDCGVLYFLALILSGDRQSDADSAAWLDWSGIQNAGPAAPPKRRLSFWQRFLAEVRRQGELARAMPAQQPCGLTCGPRCVEMCRTERALAVARDPSIITHAEAVRLARAVFQEVA